MNKFNRKAIMTGIMTGETMILINQAIIKIIIPQIGETINSLLIPKIIRMKKMKIKMVHGSIGEYVECGIVIKNIKLKN